MAVGIGLLIGILTGFAAFFGALMNMSFLLAGSASTNPVLFTLAIGLMLAWKVAGYYGVDRYLLPMLGTPVASRTRRRPARRDRQRRRADRRPDRRRGRAPDRRAAMRDPGRMRIHRRGPPRVAAGSAARRLGSADGDREPGASSSRRAISRRRARSSGSTGSRSATVTSAE